MTRFWIPLFLVACALFLVVAGGRDQWARTQDSEPLGTKPAQGDSSRQADGKEEAEPWADVRRFGAIGDGEADDTEALQRAVDAGRGRVVLPQGVYRVTRPVEVNLAEVGYFSLEGAGVARIEMAGPGPAIRLIGTHFGSADPGRFSPGVWDKERMPLVDGIAVEGKHPESIGIEAVGTMQMTLTRLHLRGLLHGIRLTQNNRNVQISDCHVYENKGVGIYYDDVNLHQSNITGCHISYNGGGGIVSRAGNVRNIHVAGCDLESNMSADGEPTANILIDCRGSQYGTAEVAITGCTIQHNNPSPDSANVRIIGNSQPTQRLPRIREGHVTISGNVLSDVQVNVHLQECRGVVLTGNTFWQGYRHNLLVESCSSVVMGANNLDRNPRYDYGNTSEANNSVVFRDCEDSTISGLHVTNVWRDPAGVIFEDCRRLNISDCTILDCDHVGMLLKNVTDSRISGCLIRDDRPESTSASIRIEGGQRTLVSNNFLGTPVQGAADGVMLLGNVVP